MPKSSEWSLALKFTHQNSVCVSTLPHTSHTRCPSHSFYDHLGNIWRESRSPSPCSLLVSRYFLPFGTNTVLSALFSKTYIFSYLSVKGSVLHPCKTILQIVSLLPNNTPVLHTYSSSKSLFNAIKIWSVIEQKCGRWRGRWPESLS